MGRNRKTLEHGGAASSRLNFAALARALPRNVVEEELAKAGRKEKRVRDLPAHVMIYYTVCMCVYANVGVCEVLDWLLLEAGNLLGWENVATATSGGISSARRRLGKDVMEALYRRVAVPLATPAMTEAWHAGLRLTALDGSTLDLQDTAENAKTFGYASNAEGDGAFPKLRFAVLSELGTHALLGARMGPYATGEITLARDIIRNDLRPGMLCLADRLYYGHEIWKEAAATGAQLLWRARADLIFSERRVLPDGSFLATVYPDSKSRKAKTGGHDLRVIQYRLTGEGAPDETYTLLTTLLDPAAHPAETLAALYPQRWDIEVAYDEFKTHLRGRRVVFRSKTPDLVAQEFYGFLLAHYCVRGLMCEAALAHGVPPVRLSFTHSVEVLKRHLTAFKAGFSPSWDGGTPPPDLRRDRARHTAQTLPTWQSPGCQAKIDPVSRPNPCRAKRKRAV